MSEAHPTLAPGRKGKLGLGSTFMLSLHHWPKLLRRASTARGHVALVALVMALTVGSTTVVAALVNALWLRPRPVTDSDRVVNITSLAARGSAPVDLLTYRDLQLFRENPLLESVAGQLSDGGLMGDFRPSLVLADGLAVETLAVTVNYFEVLGVRVRGRTLGTVEVARSDEIVVISERLWNSRFARDSTIIGGAIESSLGPLSVVGVALGAFHGGRLGERVDAWIPYTLSIRRGDFRSLSDADRQIPLRRAPFVGFGRLRPGVNLEETERSLQLLGRRVVVQPLATVYSAPGQSTIIVREGRLLALTSAACLFVLLGGCVTLASLLLVRQERRRHEFAVRLALGASRRSLVVDGALEVGAISTLGALGALGVAQLGIVGLRTLTLPGGVDLARVDLSIDWRVLVLSMAALAMLATTAGMGALLRHTRPSLALNSALASAAGTRESFAFRRLMLGIHAAATYVLVVGAVLLTLMLFHGFRAGAGFDIDRTVFVRLQPSSMQAFPTPQERTALIHRMVAGLNELREVRLAVLGRPPIAPEGGSPRLLNVELADTGRELPVAMIDAPSGYAFALGLDLVAGRLPEPSDFGNGGTLMTASLAAALRPRSRVDTVVGEPVRVDGVPRKVVGVVKDFAQGSIRGGTPFGILTVAPEVDSRRSEVQIVLATHGSAEAAVEPVRRALANSFPAAARLEIRTGRDLVSVDLARERLSARLFAGFGAIALLLGFIGTYGLVEHGLRVRWRDLGIRSALGAPPSQLMWEVARDGLSPVLIGMTCGVPVGVASLLLARALLEDITSPSLVVWVVGALVVFGSALVAATVAAARVRQLNPTTALRTT